MFSYVGIRSPQSRSDTSNLFSPPFLHHRFEVRILIRVIRKLHLSAAPTEVGVAQSQRRIAPIKLSKSLADILQPHGALPGSLAGYARPIVLDPNNCDAILAKNTNPDPTRPFHVLYPMLNGIFGQGLQKKCRHQRILNVGIGLDFYPKLVLQPKLLNFKVSTKELKLSRYWYLLFIRRECVPEKSSQTLSGPTHSLRVASRHRVNDVKRIKEKMRIDLTSEGVETSRRELGLQLLSLLLQFVGMGLFARISKKEIPAQSCSKNDKICLYVIHKKEF